MSAARRWLCVAVGTVLLVSLPFVVHSLPVSDSSVSARTLAHRIEASASTPFQGLAETVGNVALPKSDDLDALTKVYGDQNRVRVWWRDPRTWRVATLRPTGETDLVHRGNTQVRWVYESKRATLTPDVPVRLPQIPDVLPHQLARDSLDGARASELRRLAPKRVAGRTALGLRLTPAESQSAISHLDIWADRETSIPLRVEEFAKGQVLPVLSSAYLDFSTRHPSASVLGFTPPADARTRYDDIVDLASAADRFASRVPPRTLAGLPRKVDTSSQRRPGSVGVYGRGPTQLLAVPLWHRSAHRVEEELTGRVGVRETDDGLAIGAPPLRLLLGNEEPNGTRWLLFGTLTQKGLADAARELSDDPPALRGQPGGGGGGG